MVVPVACSVPRNEQTRLTSITDGQKTLFDGVSAHHAHPPTPSWDTIFGMPSVSPLAKPGTVCTFTFVASKAHSLQFARSSWSPN